MDRTDAALRPQNIGISKPNHSAKILRQMREEEKARRTARYIVPQSARLQAKTNLERKGHKGKSLTKCEVCTKLLSLFSGSFDTHQSVDLGSPRAVVKQSLCKVHPPMIEKAIGKHQLSRVKVVTAFRVDNSPTIIITGQIADNIPAIYSDNWSLLRQEATKSKIAAGINLDPKWIALNLFRQWKNLCDKFHGPKCGRFRVQEFSSKKPMWLIDCWLQCLVLSNGKEEYIALSYVWGAIKPFEALTCNIELLQKDFALQDQKIASRIPQTIRDAIVFTTVLRLRYLWVDSLCIVQDDEQHKYTQINNMASIFQGAVLTLVVTADDADFGLRGLHGASKPRSFHQETTSLSKGATLIRCRRFRRNAINVWATRGWTYQEDFFSQRQIWFHDNTVLWKCGSAEWCEETGGPYDKGAQVDPFREKISSAKFPDMTKLLYEIADYNNRKLSFPEDAHNAFAGFLSFLSSIYAGGFVSGLPVLFFDVALLWQPYYQVTRRKRRKFETSTYLHLPTWSWVGWHGKIETWSWSMANDYIKSGAGMYDTYTSARVIPTTQWYYRQTQNSAKIKIENNWRSYRFLCGQQQVSPPPQGWNRHIFKNEEDGSIPSIYFPEATVRPEYYYTHESDPESQFWYPMPMVENEATEPILAELLSCQTRRAWLLGAERIRRFRPTMSLRDEKGDWVGAIQLHEDEPSDALDDFEEHSLQRQKLELVELSRGYAYEGFTAPSLDEWGYKMRPRRGIVYEYYNVLWIEWHEGIAHRKALGRVEQSAWEAQNPQPVELVLG